MENINVIEQKNNIIDINTSIENMIFEISSVHGIGLIFLLINMSKKPRNQCIIAKN